MTTGVYMEELSIEALKALNAQPNCDKIKRIAIYGLPDVKEGRNWEIANVDCTVTSLSDIQRGVIAVHHQLGRKYHLMLDT
jgi:hypothetical protein